MATQHDTYLQIPLSFTAGTDNTLITGVPDKRIKVYKLFLIAASAVNLTFKDGGSNLTGALPIGEIVLDNVDGSPWFITSPGNGFVANLSGAVQCSGIAYYRVED